MNTLKYRSKIVYSKITITVFKEYMKLHKYILFSVTAMGNGNPLQTQKKIFVFREAKKSLFKNNSLKYKILKFDRGEPTYIVCTRVQLLDCDKYNCV